MRYVLSNAKVMDQEGQLRTVHLLVVDQHIAQVSPEAIDVPAQQCDLSGYTLMPGFINTHVHLIDCFDPFNEDKLKGWLLSGITSLRDQGILSRHTVEDAVAWRERFSRSSLHPTITLCGKFIAAPEGYGGVEPLGVSSREQAREAVRRQVAAGADHIKIALDSGFDPYTRSLTMLPLEILAEICDESHRQGKRVSAHVYQSSMLESLLKAGIDDAAHICYDPIPDHLMEYMVRNKVYITPTLSVYGELLSNWGAPFLYGAMENTKRFVDMGGVIGLGNDYINEKAIWSPVGMPMMEIELLQKAGLTMRQVIDGATLGGAKILDNPRYGAIAEGCIADLIGVRGNPYEFPYLLSDVQFVMKGGIVVKQ